MEVETSMSKVSWQRKMACKWKERGGGSWVVWVVVVVGHF